MNRFAKNIISIGIGNVLLLSFVFFLIHQGIAIFLMQLEKLLKKEVTIYWYDPIITVILLSLFIYVIFKYKD